jgi:hypothetical protein
MVERERMLNVRIAEAELIMLRELAEHLGLNQSDVVRQLLRQAHAKAFASSKPSKPKRK